MAENKKSVLLYCDIIHTVKELTDEEAGRLFKHYLAYINDLNPTPLDKLTQIVFEPIKQNLKRDLKKWNEISDKRSESGRIAGLKSAELRRTKSNQIQPNVENPTKSNQIQQVIVKDKVINISLIKIEPINIEDRKSEFADSLRPYIETYGKDMILKFYHYWSEETKSKKKFKQETEKTWNTELRLKRWSDNNFSSNKIETNNKPVIY